MDIYLIRHTTPAIELVYCYGQSDLDVAKTFPVEAKRVKAQLPDFKKVKVYSSPLIRCKKLAGYLDLGEITFDDRLKEIHFGHWEMMPWKKIDKDSLDTWKKDFVNLKAPGGESFQDMHDRVMDFFNEMLLKEKNDLLVVCHGGVIRAILSNILQIPLMNMFRLNIDFGAVSKVIVNNDEIKVDFVNR